MNKTVSAVDPTCFDCYAHHATAAHRGGPCVDSSCINCGRALLQGKWRVHILCAMRDRPVRLGQLSRLLPEHRNKALMTEPKRLVSLGIVERRDLSSDAVLNEIMPQVESEYKVLNYKNHRAIAGLSLGAMQSLYIAFDHPEVFAWVGSFSAGDLHHLPHPLPMDHTRISFRQLWISCGVNDALLPKNRQLIADLKEKGFSVTAVETPGTHDWTAWHYSLIHFAPLLFQKD